MAEETPKSLKGPDSPVKTTTSGRLFPTSIAEQNYPPMPEQPVRDVPPQREQIQQQQRQEPLGTGELRRRLTDNQGQVDNLPELQVDARRIVERIGPTASIPEEFISDPRFLSELAEEYAMNLGDLGSEDISAAAKLALRTSLRLARERKDTADAARSVFMKLDAARKEINRDSVTGLVNQTVFEERLLHEAVYGNTSFAVIFGDANNLKEYNRDKSYAVGTEYLITIAHRLAADMREEDTVARWGGDEFGIILPDSSAEDAEEIYRRKDENFKFGDEEVSIGFGLLTIDPNAYKNMTPTEVAADLADKRLRLQAALAVAKGDSKLSGRRALVRVDDPRVQPIYEELKAGAKQQSEQTDQQ